MDHPAFIRLKLRLKLWCQAHKEVLSIVFLIYSIGFVAIQQVGMMPHALAVPLAILWCVNLALCLNCRD